MGCVARCWLVSKWWSRDRPPCVSVQGVVYPSGELNKEVGCDRQPRANAFVPPHLLPWVTTYTNPGEERKYNKDVCVNGSLTLQSRNRSDEALGSFLLTHNAWIIMKIEATKRILFKLYMMGNSLQKAGCLFDDILGLIKAEHQLPTALQTSVRSRMRWQPTPVTLTRRQTLPVQDLADDNRSQPRLVETAMSLCGVCPYLELSWQRDWRDVGVM